MTSGYTVLETRQNPPKEWIYEDGLYICQGSTLQEGTIR